MQIKLRHLNNVLFATTKWLKTICVIKFLLQGKKFFIVYFISLKILVSNTMSTKLEIEELLPIDRWRNIEDMFP